MIDNYLTDDANNSTKKTYSENNKGKHGLVYRYYSSGEICEEAHFDNGKRHGYKRLYYKNGSIKQIIGYLNDELHGPYKLWDKEGNCVTHDRFYHGEKIENPFKQIWLEFIDNIGVEELFGYDKVPGPKFK